MRKCPLDTVSFIDPWAGTEFEVKKVATDHFWLCPSGQKAEITEADKAECTGPYGDLILRGELRHNGEGTQGRSVSLVYSVIKAVPCCAWNLSVKDDAALAGGKPDFRWRGPGDMPRLGDYPFAGIEASEASGPEIGNEIVNPLIVMKCRLPDQ